MKCRNFGNIVPAQIRDNPEFSLRVQRFYVNNLGNIESLSRAEPVNARLITTVICVADGYSMDRMYMKGAELDVLKKLYMATDKSEILLADDERELLNLFSQYSKIKSKIRKNQL